MIESILKRYPKEKRFLLAILQDIQRTYNYLPREALNEVREYLDIPLSSLYSMATFYRALSLKPKGKYVIRICDGTACHIRGSMNLLEEIKRELSLSPGEITPDGKFSLETVNCLGSCAIAPVMMINERVYGNLKPDMLREIFSSYGGEENGRG
ncbi:NADH-quinone oxidoreductase subunit NuoE [Thermovenabulum sp.]|uniref:NADH-quinone oxidoreductase subunit NuoE n=1 Tax=Thermovenabulum sp. TaxID=3100335 RepID=UPI003C7E7D8E